MYRDRIREHYDRLSKSQKRIADFLMTSHREAAFMTASQLAEVLSVDVATITRFAQRLKYQGYPDLLDEVQASVKEEMSAGFRPVEASSEAGRLFLRALAVEQENIERTMANISVEAAEQAVNILANARVIYIAAQFPLHSIAERMASRLRMLDLNPVVVNGEATRIATTARYLDAQDAVVGFGYSLYATDVAAVMRIARDRGAKTIGISGSDVSPVARVADVALICSATTPIHLPSDVSLSAVVEGLTQALIIQRTSAFKSRTEAFDHFYQQFIRYLDYPTGSVKNNVMPLY